MDSSIGSVLECPRQLGSSASWGEICRRRERCHDICFGGGTSSKYCMLEPLHGKTCFNSFKIHSFGETLDAERYFIQLSSSFQR